MRVGVGEEKENMNERGREGEHGGEGGSVGVELLVIFLFDQLLGDDHQLVSKTC